MARPNQYTEYIEIGAFETNAKYRRSPWLLLFYKGKGNVTHVVQGQDNLACKPKQLGFILTLRQSNRVVVIGMTRAEAERIVALMSVTPNTCYLATHYDYVADKSITKSATAAAPKH